MPPKVTVERRDVRRYEAVRPNQQVHLDFLHFFVHKAKVFLLLIEDGYSRFIHPSTKLTKKGAPAGMVPEQWPEAGIVRDPAKALKHRKWPN